MTKLVKWDSSGYWPFKLKARVHHYGSGLEYFIRQDINRCMTKAFRILSIIEGLSLIALLFIAMPAKYQFGVDLVRFAGPVHGFLWLAYLPLLEIVSRKNDWSRSMYNFAFITSVLPFGCFLLEKRFRSNTLATT